MKRENRRNILLRYGLIVFIILLLSLRIVYKLVDNTVLSAKEWNKLAEKTLSHIDTIPPVRGDILAADGSVLATNIRVYTVYLDFRVPNFDEKNYRKCIPELADSLALHFPKRTKKQWEAYLNKPLAKVKGKRTRSFPIADRVSSDDITLLRTFPFLKEKKSRNGLHFDDKLIRVNPYGEMGIRSIGIVGETKESKERHGVYGLERALDSLLAGKVGYSKKVPLTSAIVDWTDKPAVDGYDVLTTIDIKMQDIVETELNNALDSCQAEWGAAVMMEVGTGDIKAIANLELSPEPGVGYIESRNYAVERCEPGSVVKLLSLLVAMEDNKVPDLNKEYRTGAKFTLFGVSCSDCVKSDKLPLSRALEFSSNIVMSRMILEAYGKNPGEFYTRVKQTGILKPFNTGIAEEMVPRFDSLGCKPYDKLSLTRQAFGYTTAFSPLYTCALYNAVAGGGKFVKPRLVRGLRGNGIDTTFAVSYVGDRLCSEQNAAKLREMLHAVVWGERGTARHMVKSDKVEIAGKTGTAKMLYKGQYISRYRMSFCGFFPYDKPRYTLMVIVAYPQKPGSSPEKTSGLVVKRVAEAMYARGMFGDRPDFHKIEQKHGDYPTYYAGLGDRGTRLHAMLGGGSQAVMSEPKSSGSGVPDVLGLGLRDALSRLEEAGYNVAFTGSGFVAGQKPLPGDKCPKGTRITLELKE